MTAAEITALATIQGLAAANRIALGGHARDRMADRGARYADVRRALMTATNCRDQRADPTTAGDWLARGGVDTDGDELSCAVIIQSSVVVVTIF